MSAYITKFSVYKCAFKCFQNVRTDSHSLIVSGKVFQIDAAIQENALAPFDFFEPLVAMRSRSTLRFKRMPGSYSLTSLFAEVYLSSATLI